MAYTYISSWFKKRGLPLVDERAQADAYVACALMSEKLDECRRTCTATISRKAPRT
jgi:hypothetical protein